MFSELLCVFLFSVSFAICDFPIQNGDQIDNYYGTVHENIESRVKLMPPFRYPFGVVCDVRIVNDIDGDQFSLAKAKSVDYNDIVYDEWLLKTKAPLDYEKQVNFQFQVLLKPCKLFNDGSSSPKNAIPHNATVHVTVLDENEYTPEFIDESYVADVDEGRLYESIVKVTAIDHDKGPIFGKIYKYAILPDNIDMKNAKVMFDITKEGMLKNLYALNYSDSHNYILSVVAYDGGHRVSKPVFVTVRVRQACRPGWLQLPQSIKYTAKAAVKYLVPLDSRLETCDAKCQNATTKYKVELGLHVRHLGKSCNDHINGYQIEKQLCKNGEHEQVFEFLPLEKDQKAFGKWFEDRSITSFIDVDADNDEIYYFNGQSTALSVPEDYFDDNKLNSIFTISTWLKHEQRINQDKHIKEHIVCSADDHKMNRHHYALFIRNCRLILLLRRDFANGDLNIFKPAEWRWKLPQVCDKQWHHYAIVVNFPNVQLYVDSELYVDTKNTSEVIDDWPLHPTNDIRTRLTVGACWQGGESRFKHFFNGYLAGLTILTNQTIEQTRGSFIAACLYQCHEQLQVPPLDYLQPGMELVTNNDQSVISVSSDKVADLEMMVKQVSYKNNERVTSVKKRHLSIVTYRQCDETSVELDSRIVNVLVTKDRSLSSQIRLNGTNHLVRKHTELESGVRIFPDLFIQSSDQESLIDFCIININPPLNSDHENLSVVDADSFNLKVFNENNTKIKISGPSTIFTYRQILRQVQYSNSKPFYYLNRVFKVVCQDDNSSQKSDQYVQTVNFLHPKIKEIVSKVMRSPLHSVPAAEESLYQARHEQLVAAEIGSSYSVTIIVVICAGFLLFLVLMGTIHVRGHFSSNVYTVNRRAGNGGFKSDKNDSMAGDLQQAEPEMIWDDSGMSIIINPMENLEKKMNPVASATFSHSGSSDQFEDEEEQEDEDDVYDDEEYDEEDEEDEEDPSAIMNTKRNYLKAKRSSHQHHQYQSINQLEWDHSTI